MKRKKLNKNIIHKTLSRSEMRDIIAGGSGDPGGGGGGTGGGCYICIGGIHCYQVGPGQRGRTTCTNKGYPNYGCNLGTQTCVG